MLVGRLVGCLDSQGRFVACPAASAAFLHAGIQAMSSRLDWELGGGAGMPFSQQAQCLVVISFLHTKVVWKRCVTVP